MAQYDGYYLVSDMDGTLLNSQSKVSAKNIEAIRHFISEGGKFGIATGRTPFNIEQHMVDIPLNTPCILYNGSELYDFPSKTVVRYDCVDKEKVYHYLLHCMASYSKINLQIFTPEGLFVVSDRENKDELLEADGGLFHFANIQDTLKHDWIKVMLVDSHERLLHCEQEIPSFIGEGVVDTVFSFPQYLELLKAGVSKGSMLCQVREMPDVKGRKVVAVGDFNNDIEMICEADLGLATANANKDVKAAADQVIVSNDEDAIHYIIHNLLV